MKIKKILQSSSQHNMNNFSQIHAKINKHPTAIAYSMGQIIKSVCVCQSIIVWALSRSHFLIDFHQNWHRR